MVVHSTDSDILGVILKYYIYPKIIYFAIAFPKYIYMYYTYVYVWYLKIVLYTHIVQNLNILSLWFPQISLHLFLNFWENLSQWVNT